MEFHLIMMSHNPYFNRWFSAMTLKSLMLFLSVCHNPYFNRWFSAMVLGPIMIKTKTKVTILILIDGFLQ